jgi:hypothetical protein
MEMRAHGNRPSTCDAGMSDLPMSARRVLAIRMPKCECLPSRGWQVARVSVECAEIRSSETFYNSCWLQAISVVPGSLLDLSGRRPARSHHQETPLDSEGYRLDLRDGSFPFRTETRSMEISCNC